MDTHVVVTNQARKGFEKAPKHIQAKFRDWVLTVELEGLASARKYSSFHDEPLSGQRKGQRSIRLNAKWRTIYVESEDGVITITVLEVTPHDYRTR